MSHSLEPLFALDIAESGRLQWKAPLRRKRFTHRRSRTTSRRLSASAVLTAN